MPAIFHLTPKQYFDALDEDSDFMPAEFEADGFIHCTGSRAKMLEVANRYYKDVPGEFLLLVINEEAVIAEVVWEDGSPPDPDGTQFPHIYGPLNRDAIEDIIPMNRLPDGTFQW